MKLVEPYFQTNPYGGFLNSGYLESSKSLDNFSHFRMKTADLGIRHVKKAHCMLGIVTSISCSPWTAGPGPSWPSCAGFLFLCAVRQMSSDLGWFDQKWEVHQKNGGFHGVSPIDMGIEAGKRWFDHRTCGCNMISPGATCDVLEYVCMYVCIYI